MDDYQAQIDALNVKLDSLNLSSGIGRDTETALRERLGLTTVAQAFPVGAIFLSTVATDPATLLGYGTWVAFGSGQVPVGYASGDSDFGTLLATGGEKTHTLTTPEIPSHSHAMDPFYHGAGGTNQGNSSGTAVSVNPFTGPAGGGGSHNNLQPFIVVMMWKRTA